MKVARSLALSAGVVSCLHDTLAKNRLNTLTYAGADAIPEVGIGAIHPVCDSVSSQCSSSDEQVQQELITGLEANGQVSGRCFAALNIGWVPSDYIPNLDLALSGFVGVNLSS